MPKFKILWIEHHNPLNWGDTEEEGIKAIKDCLPKGSDVHFDQCENDGWVECECEDYFEAKDIKEAKRYIKNNYDCDIYSVFKQEEDKKWTRCFTEEIFCKIIKPIKSIAKRKEKKLKEKFSNEEKDQLLELLYKLEDHFETWGNLKYKVVTQCIRDLNKIGIK